MKGSRQLKCFSCGLSHLDNLTVLEERHVTVNLHVLQATVV